MLLYLAAKKNDKENKNRCAVSIKREVNMRLFVLLVVMVLTGCTPALVRPGDLSLWFRGQFAKELSPVITLFETGKGTGSRYRLGEEVRFNLGLEQSGYVVLVGIDPDETFYELGRYYLGAGTHVLPVPGENTSFRLGPPSGWQRVRVIYTNTSHAPVSLAGSLATSADVDSASNFYLEQSRASAYDVAETYFIIQP
jgi:hypothetical protein